MIPFSPDPLPPGLERYVCYIINDTPLSKKMQICNHVVGKAIPYLAILNSRNENPSITLSLYKLTQLAMHGTLVIRKGIYTSVFIESHLIWYIPRYHISIFFYSRGRTQRYSYVLASLICSIIPNPLFYNFWQTRCLLHLLYWLH